MGKQSKNIYDLIGMARDALDHYKNCIGFERLYTTDDFSLVSSYIALRALTKGKNIYICTGTKDSTRDLTLPVLYPVACMLLQDESAAYTPSFDKVKMKSTFIADGVCWKYKFMSGKDSLASKVKGGWKYHHFSNPGDILESHFVADLKYYSDSKCHKVLGDYIAFYAAMVQDKIQPPSFFSKKVVVVTNKSYLFEQLRDLSLIHCFPIAGITANHDDLTGESLAIDPMILVASDYGLAREYMLKYQGETQFEYLIMSGETKISKLKSQVKNDCANGLFSRYCMIGNQVIAKDNSMFLWHWDRREEKYLRGKHGLEISMDPITRCEPLIEAANDYYQCLNTVFEEFGTSEHFGKTKLYLRRILSDKLGMIGDFDTELGDLVTDEVSKSLLSDNYELCEFDACLELLVDKLRTVYKTRLECPSLLEKLAELSLPILPLVVHKHQASLWKVALEQLNLVNVKLLTYKEFKSEITSRYARQLYVFVFLPNYEQTAWLSGLILDRKISLRMILYPPETSIMKSQLRKIRKWEGVNSGPKDKTLFPEIDIEAGVREASDDIIGRFEDQFPDTGEDHGVTGYDNHAYASYTIEVLGRDDVPVRLSCPQKIIKIDDTGIELIPVAELEEGEQIMLYANKSRESLYSILSEESEKFARVNSDSRLWKRRLREYVRYTIVNEEDFGFGNGVAIDRALLQKVALYIGVNAEYVLKHWITKQDAIMFPMKSKFELMLKFLRENDLLIPDEIDRIRSSRSFFVGVMISLGQNLSSEAQSTMLNKGDCLEEYVDRYVSGNTSEYPILSRFDAGAVSSIIRYNFQEYKFLKIIEQGVDTDEE